MLSDYERRELALIEEGLRADPRFMASFPGGAHRRRGWPVKALVVGGLWLALAGMLVGAGQLVLEGVLITVAGLAWGRWRAARAAATCPPPWPEDTSPGPGPTRPTFGPV